MGRISLENAMLDGVEQLDAAPGEREVAVSDKLFGTRVRVRTPGGHYIIGTQTRSGDGSVTVRTDSGATVTLRADTVEPVGTHPAVRLKTD